MASEFVSVIREHTLTVYETNGTGAAVPVLVAQLRPMREAEVVSLVHNLTPYLRAPRSEVDLEGAPVRPVKAKYRTRAEPKPKRVERLPASKRAETLRAMVEAEPGIYRVDVFARLGLNNPSGTQWAEIVRRSGVVPVKEGAGRGARIRYYPAEDHGDAAQTNA